MLHHADRVDEVFGQLLRVIDALQVQVHHEVVLVGAHFLAVGVKTKHRLVAAGLELLDDLAAPNGMTSTGSGNLPMVSTTLDSSTIHTIWLELVATIFSHSRAAPPPLIAVEVLVDFVGAVNGHVDVVHVSMSTILMP